MTEIHIIQLNNKSRKGTYARIRENNKTKYYKIRPGMTPEQVIQHYKEEYKRTKSRTGARHIKNVKPTSKHQRPKKTQLIEKQLGTGIRTTTLETNMTQTKKQEAITKLIMKTVKNKKIAQEIAKEHNLKKVSTRFSHKLTVIGEDGETLLTMTKAGITPQKALREIKELQIGDYLDISPGARDLVGKGWSGKLEKEGVIKKIKMKTTFRKRK